MIVPPETAPVEYGAGLTLHLQACRLDHLRLTSRSALSKGEADPPISPHVHDQNSLQPNVTATSQTQRPPTSNGAASRPDEPCRGGWIGWAGSGRAGCPWPACR